jgi:uncharacterized membrane protein YhaH (DUF805 family)
MANCQKCGENNSAEARFCSSCGVAIGVTSMPPPPPVSRVVVAQTSPQPVQQVPEQPLQAVTTEFSAQPELGAAPDTSMPPQAVGFVEAIKICLSKYATFGGRACRSEFWWFYLFSTVLTWGVLFAISDTASNLVSLALLLPTLAAGARRLHDTGRSGWWQLITITLIGIPFLIYWFACAGKPEANKYGEPV